jgi:hypothetical protein
MDQVAVPRAPARHASAGRIAVAIVALLAPVRVAGQPSGHVPSFGPLTSEEGGPLQRISYTATAEGADVLAPGSVSTEVWLGLSNIFEQDSASTHVLFLDLERLITALTVRFGVRDGLELGGRLTLETTGGGFLDSAILWWHDRLGLGQANRDRFPEGEYRQRLADGGGAVFLEAPRRTLGLEEVRLFAKWRAAIAEDGRSALALRATTRLPTHSDLVGSESPDIALAALGRVAAGSWYLHGMMGASTVGASPTELDGRVSDLVGFLTLGVERSLGSSVAGVVQWSIASAVLRDFHDRELDRAPSNLVLGLAGRAGGGWRWDVSFQEDVPADTPAIDFQLGLRLSRSW